jgi:hypothetical protein
MVKEIADKNSGQKFGEELKSSQHKILNEPLVVIQCSLLDQTDN